MKLLLTEDDEQLGGALQAILIASGYAVTWVRSAEDAQRFLESEILISCSSISSSRGCPGSSCCVGSGIAQRKVPS